MLPCRQTLTQRLHPLPLGLLLTYPTGVHTLSHLRTYAGPPTPAAVHRGEAGSTRWAALGPLKVWSLLEMADAGIVPERIDDAKVVEGACDGV